MKKRAIGAERRKLATGEYYYLYQPIPLEWMENPEQLMATVDLATRIAEERDGGPKAMH